MAFARISRFPAGLAAALSCLAGAGPALAQDLAAGVGEIGLSFGGNSVSALLTREADVAFVGIEGSYSVHVAPQVLLGFDASWRMDDVKSDAEFDFFGAPESQSVLAVHALWEPGADTRVGAFLAYGDSRVQDLPGDRSFDYWLYGLEARHFVNDNLMLFGQLALGDDDDGDGLFADSGEGFNSGRSLRLGGTWFSGDRSAFTLDIEYATADPYIDDTDAGEFFGVTLSGETRVAASMPLFATYSLQSNWLDATTEQVSVRETSLGIGIRYVFGADTPREAARAGRSIGTPELPGRASVWTLFNDD